MNAVINELGPPIKFSELEEGNFFMLGESVEASIWQKVRISDEFLRKSRCGIIQIHTGNCYDFLPIEKHKRKKEELDGFWTRMVKEESFDFIVTPVKSLTISK